MSPKNVTAYRGYYVNMDNIIPVLTQLLIDAEKRKTKVILVGGENIKLDGAIMSIRALKEALYDLEVFGDLVPLPDPIKEVPPDDKTPEVNKDIETIKGQITDVTAVDPALLKDQFKPI